MTEGLIADEQGGLREGKGCVDLHPEKIGEKAREKKRSACGFSGLGEGI